MSRATKALLACSAVAAGVLGLAGCAVTPDNGNSDADKAAYNVMMDAEGFKVQRTIIGQSGISDKIFMMAEGRCSFEYPSDNRVDIICKIADDEYKRDTMILGDQDRVYIAQEEPIDVSVYKTRVIFKPESLLPEFDISVGQQ
jgi:hypothetical protein